MGLIKKLKEIFNKNIECGSESCDHIISFMNKKKYLYLNKNIFVCENFACVIVYKYKMCDVVLAGKYRINQDSIPETYGRAKIEKTTKRGRRVRRIRADVYCVRLDNFKNFTFESDIPFKVKTREFGRIKGCLSGACTIKIIDAGAVVKYLIATKGRVKTKNIHKIIGLLVGNKINQIIQKNKIPTSYVLSNQEYVESIVNEGMQDALDKQGLFVTNVKLKSVNFPKKYQAKVNNYLSTNQRKIKDFNINEAFGTNRVVVPKVEVGVRSHPVVSGTMQNMQNTRNNNHILVCKVCKKKNDFGSKVCINCGNKLN